MTARADRYFAHRVVDDIDVAGLRRPAHWTIRERLPDGTDREFAECETEAVCTSVVEMLNRNWARERAQQGTP